VTAAFRIARLARAQRALARVAEAESAAAAAAVSSEKSEYAAIVAALNRDGPIHGPVVAAMADALKASGRRSERLAHMADEARRRAAREDAAARILMAQADKARKADARHQERRRLEEIATARSNAASKRWSGS
jgi:hypothetical protein